MSTLYANASAVIDASPEAIYGLLADYRTGHPQILPQRSFGDLIIEEGGYGAGTVFRVTTRAGRIEQKWRMIVSEPEPGRVLVDTDMAPTSTLTTTFSVMPVADGQQARVEIATKWESRAGIAGLMERLFYPSGMRRIFQQELRQLASVIAARRGTPAASVA